MSGLIQSVAAVLKQSLDLLYGLTNSYGVSILILTFLIRLIMHPLVVTQTRTTEAMKVINPKLQELQRKYKDNKDVYNERVFQLYKEYKINPMSGCLPMLIQIPILFGFLAMLRAYDFGTESFLWLPSLTEPDPYYVLPILTGLTTYFQLMMSAADPTQRTMTFFMPVFITAVSLKFQSGLALYWVASNVFTIFQQWWIREHLPNLKGEEKENEVGIGRKHRKNN